MRATPRVSRIATAILLGLAALQARHASAEEPLPAGSLRTALGQASPAVPDNPPIDGGDLRFSADLPGGWRGFWDRHKYHFLTVFLAEETEYLYHGKVGVSDSPLLFDRAPGIDRAVHDRVYDDQGSSTFVSQNKTNLFRVVALGSILATDRLDWGRAADDVMGLIEATKFNTATTGLVKMIVGRRRPKVDQVEADPLTAGSGQAAADQGGGHLSFYSQATSQAFTYASYLDLVVARRLVGHPVARSFTAAGLYGLAAYIGYSRMEQGEHYLTDVIAGAGAGYLVGRSFYRANHREEIEQESPGREPRFHFLPPTPVPGGAALGVSIRLDR